MKILYAAQGTGNGNLCRIPDFNPCPEKKSRFGHPQEWGTGG